MPTTRKNVSDYLRMAGWVLLSLIIAVIFIFVIPANISFWRKWFIADRHSEMGLLALGIALIFLAYEAYRFIKRTENPWRSVAIIVVFVVPANVLFWVALVIVERESSIGLIALGILSIFLAYKAYKTYRFIKRLESPWQTFKGNLKKNLIIFFSFAFAIYACMVLFVTLFPTEYDLCDFYNERLNGGVKEFQGQKFRVHMCGTGAQHTFFFVEDEEIRLQVFNEKGDLVALRHFAVNLDSNPRGVLRYHADHITYFDISSKGDFEKTISMPPTTLDWIRSRIPLLD